MWAGRGRSEGKRSGVQTWERNHVVEWMEQLWTQRGQRRYTAGGQVSKEAAAFMGRRGVCDNPKS